MTAKASTLSMSLNRHKHRRMSTDFARRPYCTWTASATAHVQIGSENNFSNHDRPIWTSEGIQSHSSALQETECVPYPHSIAHRKRCRRTSGDESNFCASLMDDDNAFSGSLEEEIATALVISQHRPQAIKVIPRSALVIPTKDEEHHQTPSSPIPVVNIHSSNYTQYTNEEAQGRPTSSDSWISQSTISDVDSFSAIESTTSASTTTSTHMIVKGFTPGGPPSMYRSQSNLSQLSRLVTLSRSNTPATRSPSPRNRVSDFDEDIQNECPIDEDYEDFDSYSDFDDRGSLSGLTMLFASARTVKPSKVIYRPSTLSARKTRNQMLAAELTRPIQESLLQDRQHKRQVNQAAMRRSQSEILYSDCYFNEGIFQYW